MSSSPSSLHPGGGTIRLKSSSRAAGAAVDLLSVDDTKLRPQREYVYPRNTRELDPSARLSIGAFHNVVQR